MVCVIRLMLSVMVRPEEIVGLRHVRHYIVSVQSNLCITIILAPKKHGHYAEGCLKKIGGE